MFCMAPFLLPLVTGLDEDCHQNYLELGVRGPVAHFSSLRSGPFGPAPHVLPILTFLSALTLSPCPLTQLA